MLVMYSADVISYSDYSPYGTVLDGRFEEDAGYRYGFQGQEKDNEVKGNNNSLNYEYRMHDPRIGRFFAVDPLASKYPHNSPYAFSENRVIDGVELEGLEVHLFTDNKNNVIERPDMALLNKDAILFYASQNSLYYLGYYTNSSNGLRDYYNADGSPRKFNQGATASTITITKESSASGVKRASAGLMVMAAEAEGGSGGTASPLAVPAAIIGAAIWVGSYARELYDSDSYEHISTTSTTYPLPAASSSGIANPPFTIPIDYVTDNTYSTTFDENQYITLFRGVPDDHPQYAPALIGSAIPLGGNASMVDHWTGNTNSNYTSWTSSPFMASTFALKNGASTGIVLVKKFHIGQVKVSPDHYNEGEFTITGPVHGAIPVPVIDF